MRGDHYLVPDPMGSFLEHPDSPAHRWHVEVWRRRAREPDAMISLTHFFESAEFSQAAVFLKRERPELVDWKSRVRPIDDPAVRAWIRELYSYFRSCYLPEGREGKTVTDWECRLGPSDPDTHGRFPAERHAAVVIIRRLYPRYEPELRLDPTYPREVA